LEAKQIEAATWTMLTGLFLSVAALALLPRVNESAQQGIKAQREL
jgi:hypothetical protein